MELRTFTEWLRPEKSQLQKDLEKCIELYDRYWGILEFATPEEKGLLKRYGYIVDPIITLLPKMILIKFYDKETSSSRNNRENWHRAKRCNVGLRHNV